MAKGSMTLKEMDRFVEVKTRISVRERIII